jgi:nitrite reductase/ring-hydroxylating ferredoxin subunit
VAETTWYRVFAVGELAAGRMRAWWFGAPEVVVCRTRAGLYALDNVCSHAHTKMHEGRLRGVRLICPLHGAAFDVRSGAVLGAPATAPLASHPVRIAGGQVEVALGS